MRTTQCLIERDFSVDHGAAVPHERNQASRRGALLLISSGRDGQPLPLSRSPDRDKFGINLDIH